MFFLRLYIRSSASPRMTVVWHGFWNSDHVLSKLSTHSQASPQGWQSNSTSGSMTMMKLGSMTGCMSQNAVWLCLAQHCSGINVTLNVFLSPLKYIWQLYSVKFSVSVTFFCDGTGRDGTWRTDGQTDIGTDRLFSENIILDFFTQRSYL